MLTGETGGNLNVNKIDISHTHNYYSSFAHSHLYGIRWGVWYGSAAEIQSRWIYNNGTWDATTTTVDKAQSISTNTNFTKGKVSVDTMNCYEITANTSEIESTIAQTGNMSANKTINAQDPYTVVYMWEKIE